MAFTAAEIANIANASLDFYIKGEPFKQSIQDKPLLKAMQSAQKTFPGGKGYIDIPVKGNYDSYFAGYSHDDTVAYGNPTNIKRVKYSWKEIHGGLSITHSELKNDGISVVDTNGNETSEHSGREKTVLVNLLKDKLEDMTEGMSRDLNAYFWNDGTSDAKGPAGVLSFLTDTPTSGTTGGLDRSLSANSWWRHRTALSQNTGSVDLAKLLTTEYRQLRRYGGDPKLWIAGSSFLGALESQLYAKGYFTMTGFSASKNDMGIADITFSGNKIAYDPTLDDLGYAKYLFVIDTSKLFPYVMTGEDMKQHSPSRPADKYVLYRGVTWTGNMVCTQLNCHGKYSIA